MEFFSHFIRKSLFFTYYKWVFLPFVLFWKKNFCTSLTFFISNIVGNIFLVTYQKIKLGTVSFLRERRFKSIAQFPISQTWETYYLQALNCIHLYLWHEIFPHNCASATNFFFSFSKNNVIFWKYVQNKGNVWQDTFLDFAHITP